LIDGLRKQTPGHCGKGALRQRMNAQAKPIGAALRLSTRVHRRESAAIDVLVGPARHISMPNAAAPLPAISQARQEGFEPPTIGSEVEPLRFLQVFRVNTFTHSTHFSASTYKRISFRRFRLLSVVVWVKRGTFL
jgi:hypothetical protein